MRRAAQARPGDGEDDLDAAAPVVAGPVPAVRRHDHRVIAAGAPLAPPDADDVSRVVAEAQLPAGLRRPAAIGDGDLPEEPGVPLAQRLELHDRRRPGRGPSRPRWRRLRPPVRAVGRGRGRRQPLAGAGRRQLLRCHATQPAVTQGLPAGRGRAAIADDGLGHRVGHPGGDDHPQAGREGRRHHDTAHGRARGASAVRVWPWAGPSAAHGLPVPDAWAPGGGAPDAGALASYGVVT
jgi:hypothetical protein